MKIKKYNFTLVDKITFLLIFLTFLISLIYSLKQFESFHSFHPRDFATEAQPAFQTLFAGKFYNTNLVPDNLFLQTHFSIIPILMMPFIIIFPYPETLLFLKIIFIFTGAIYLYYLSKKILKNDIFSLFITLFYTIYVPIQYIILNDWRYTAFYIPAIIILFYYYIKRSYKGFIIFSLLVIFLRDEGVLALLFFPLIEYINHLLVKKKSKFALFKDHIDVKKYIITPLLLIILYVIFIQIIIKKIMGEITGYKLSLLFVFQKYGNSTIEAIKYIFTHPFQILLNDILDIRKINFIFNDLLYYLLYLPIIGIQTFILAIPSILLYMLFDYPTHLSISSPFYLTTAGIRYTAIFLPFFLISVIYAMKNLKILIKNQKILKIFIITLFLIITFINLKNSPLPYPFSTKYNPSRFSITKRDENIKNMIKFITRKDSLTTQFDYLAYFLNLKYLSDINQAYNFDYTLIPLGNYIFIDLKKRWYFNIDAFFFNLWRARESSKYKLIRYYDGAFILATTNIDIRPSPPNIFSINVLWDYIFSNKFLFPFYKKYSYVKNSDNQKLNLLYNYENKIKIFKPQILKNKKEIMLLLPISKNGIKFKKKYYLQPKENEFPDNLILNIVIVKDKSIISQLNIKPVFPFRLWKDNKTYLNYIKLSDNTSLKNRLLYLNLIIEKNKKKIILNKVPIFLLKI